MQWSIIHHGECIGTAEAVREGLYWRVNAVCRQTDEVLHLYLCGREKAAVSLGVPVPENGMLVLRKKFAASSFFPQEDGEVTTTDGVRVCGVRVPGGRIEDGRLFVPYNAKSPFPLMEWVSFFRMERIDGRWYWVCALSEEGTPAIFHTSCGPA